MYIRDYFFKSLPTNKKLPTKNYQQTTLFADPINNSPSKINKQNEKDGVQTRNHI